MVTVLSLIDAVKVGGPCRGLFQLVKHCGQPDLRFVLGMFLAHGAFTSAAIEEARRRGVQTTILAQKRRYDPWLIPQAWRVVRRHGITVLQSHGYKPAILAWCLKWFTGLPWIAFVHGYTSENLRIAIYNRLDQWLLRRADLVVAVSEATGLKLRDAGVPWEKIRVIHNAIDPEDHQLDVNGTEFRRQCRAAPDNLLVGVIGRLSPEKGQAVFVRAFEEVVRTVSHARAVLVGEGQELERLRASVRAVGLDSRVTFAGYQADMSSVYAALDLVVIPSLSEGLPNVLLEAFLHGKAVIATAVGGIPEVMQGSLSRWLVPPGDAKALADKIIEIMHDSDLRIGVSETGKRYVQENFSVLRRCQQMEELYREVARSLV